MAKKEKGSSFDDFFEENIDLDEQEEEQEENEEEQEEEKDKKKSQPKGKSKEKDEEESDEESEEDEPEDKKKSKEKEKTKKVEKKKEETKDESEEEESEEDNEEEQEEDEKESFDVDPKTFFEAVDKITGLPVEVDFGDTDPLTPEGIAIRDKAVREAALDAFVTELEEGYPQVFKALQHAYNGGDVAELFKEIAATRDYSKVELKEDDEALATEILKEYYQSKGIKSEARIKKLIETAQDSEEGLVGEARPLLEELKAEQADRQTKIAEEQKKQATEQKKRDGLLVEAVDEVLEKGTLSNFKLQPKEGKEFRSFIMGAIQRQEAGKYSFVMPIEPNNLEKQLQYMYFQFKKGNIQDLVQIKKETKEAGKLRLGISKEKAKVQKSTEQENKNNWSLKDYEE